MNIIKDIKQWRERYRPVSGSVGFVPTMGGLHDGHLSLCERSQRETDTTVVSLFLNPTQFDNEEDLKTYPYDLNQDLEILKKQGVDFVITPQYADLYPDNYRYRVTENQLSHNLCGKYRPGHFDGVLTVVMKLLNLIEANRAYFGEKDYQQLELVSEMVEAFFMPTTIVPCPTVRERDGLAMSSRNRKLNPQQRELAPELYKTLRSSESASAAEKKLSSLGFLVDYVKDIDGRRFGAVKLGSVRLIDNVPQP